MPGMSRAIVHVGVSLVTGICTLPATPPDYRAEGQAMSAIDPAALVVIAFVQDGARNVLQAARATVK